MIKLHIGCFIFCEIYAIACWKLPMHYYADKHPLFVLLFEFLQPMIIIIP